MISRKKLKAEILATQGRLDDLEALQASVVRLFPEHETKSTRHRNGRTGVRTYVPKNQWAGQTIRKAVTVYMSRGQKQTVAQIAREIFGRASKGTRGSISNVMCQNKQQYNREGTKWFVKK